MAEVHDSLGELAQAGTYREQAMRAAGISTQPTVSFTSAESSIERGKNATLSWKATYATEVEISPDLGRVPAKGTRSVAPAATTTYQLVARGPGGVTNASVQITVTLPRLTEENIVDLLKNEVPKARIARVASERGISFDLSPEVEKRLRTAGADDSLIEALKKARR